MGKVSERQGRSLKVDDTSEQFHFVEHTVVQVLPIVNITIELPPKKIQKIADEQMYIVPVNEAFQMVFRRDTIVSVSYHSEFNKSSDFNPV